MARRISDNIPEEDRVIGRLRSNPFPEERRPSEERIAFIRQRAVEAPGRARTTGRRWIGWSAAVLACLILMAAVVYAYDMPGGIADWRYSRAAGYPGTVSIPLGKTPEDAVRKFRRSPAMQVVHQESAAGGVMMFIKRGGAKNGTDLQLEFVRRTWLGWKWVMGGGYGISPMSGADEALNFMSMPAFPGIQGPFPIVFGQISNPAVANVNVTIGGRAAGSYGAKIIEYGDGQKLWYVLPPSAAAPPYGIEALNAQGEMVAAAAFDDQRDVGAVPMRGTEFKEAHFRLGDIITALEGQRLQLQPSGAGSSSLAINNVQPNVYGVETEETANRADPELVCIYIFKSVKARTGGAEAYREQMGTARSNTYPILYEKGNVLVIYQAASKEKPAADHTIQAALDRLNP
ncbi:hypothetical protein [Paenibacillus humicola]|uniref:hypothetical protein n=1 Tax=Paenibacillus humicola TaxID=3110540 RepID=UPI00237BC737|nr:hypothetical protein [Paenibacillus humicola]